LKNNQDDTFKKFFCGQNSDLSLPHDEIATFDLRIEELRDLSNNQHFNALVDIVQDSHTGLIHSGSRVGSITAGVNDDGCLVIRFVSRYKIIK